MLNENVYTYINNKKRLIPLNKKIPILNNWVNSNLSREEIENYNTTNYGWALNKTDLVIDVDPRNGGEESIDKLINNIGVKLFPTVKTPGGGYHIYLSKPENININKSIKDYPGIDFLSIGTQCVIAGSTTNIGKYEWINLNDKFKQLEAPTELLSIINRNDNVNDNLDIELESMIDYNNQIDYSENDIINMLESMDPSCIYDTWIKIGMALHSWHNINGYKLWEEWSQKGNNYKPNETIKHWKSFDNKPINRITMGTLVFMSNKNKKNIDKKHFEQLITNVESCSDKQSLELSIESIKKIKLNNIDKEIITKKVQSKFKDLYNTKIPINKIRKKINNIEFNDDNLKWCKEWLYVNSHNAFFNIKSKQFYRTESFNMENGRNIIENESGAKQSASKFVADNGLIERVDCIAYNPEDSNLIVNIEGKKVLNTFDFKNIPTTAEKYTDKGLLTIENIKTHIRIICNDNVDNIDILTQWIAHQVRYPGKKILWGPIIQSIQGIGKSFFGELLRYCIGDKNVGTVSPGQVTSQFNGWAGGVVVNVLEELRIVGHNRFDVINALKPLITDRIIQINEKGIKQYTFNNTTNYICFTNYRDAIPIDKDDRRWWVLFNNIKSINELETKANKTAGKYFEDLFDGLRQYSNEVRKWLIEYQITDNFKSTKQAPVTNYKLSMIETEDNNLEGLFEAKDLLNRGGKYFNLKCLDSAAFFEQLLYENPELIINSFNKNKILKNLGFNLYPQRMRIDSIFRKIWIIDEMSKLDILKEFENYIPKNEENEENIVSNSIIDILETL